ncbi:MAG: ABC transporter substrate-binding protein [Hyphomicrobiaceae bacterium]
MASHNKTRREFLKDGALATGAMGLSLGGLVAPAVGQSQFSEWGWPQPRGQVLAKSVDWLKSKGWWPLQVAWNPLWSDGNIVLFAMQHYKLLQARGIEAQFPEFLIAGLMNEVFVPAKIQVAQAGSLGLLRIIELKVPVVAPICYPAQRQGFMVPIDSPLKGLADLKGQKVLGRPAQWGTAIGSAVHTGLLVAAKVLGLREGEDFQIKNMSAADMMAMPKGVDLVCMWEPNITLMTEFRKNARILETMAAYTIFNGYSYLRGEIEENAPDVVQAYVDAFIEARLLVKLKSQEVLAAFAAHDSQRGRDPKLIARDAETHVLNPKPTLSYPFEDTRGFWAPLETYQANIMTDANVLKRRFTENDFKSALRTKYQADTFSRLGWSVPKQPTFLPANWTGEVGKPPTLHPGLRLLESRNFLNQAIS